MKVIILAGGFGTRLAEATDRIPKPMVEIGGRPILWHIMKYYAHFDYDEFYVALGYKGKVIKDYFLHYHTLNSNISVNLRNGNVDVSEPETENWTIHLQDTGLDTMKGGRLKRLESHLSSGRFMVTYGDGVCNVDLDALMNFHRSHDLIGTVTAARPPARFGGLRFKEDRVAEFIEKAQMGEGWINGGFMVFEPAIFNYLEDDSTRLEADTLESLAADNQLAAYRHDGFWQCMDHIRHVNRLRELWDTGEAPWKMWD
jgi:glucose-1-phosphate cytidylyltransferase